MATFMHHAKMPAGHLVWIRMRFLGIIFMYFEYFDYFHIGNRSDVVILQKIVFFFRSMDDSHKRSHVETGNTPHPHKPAEKKIREIESTHEEPPVRRSLGFQQRSSPAQKVIVFMNNLCKMYTWQCT